MQKRTQIYTREYPIRVMCRALEVSESGYSAWKERPAGDHEREDARIAAEIQQIFQEHRQVYGIPRIHAVLQLIEQIARANDL